MPEIEFQTVCVDTASRDQEGLLVMVDGRLAGVLVRLDGEEHGPLRGAWFLETGFGLLDRRRPEPFKTMEEARAWIESELERT